LEDYFTQHGMIYEYLLSLLVSFFNITYCYNIWKVCFTEIANKERLVLHQNFKNISIDSLPVHK